LFETIIEKIKQEAKTKSFSTCPPIRADNPVETILISKKEDVGIHQNEFSSQSSTVRIVCKPPALVFPSDKETGITDSSPASIKRNADRDTRREHLNLITLTESQTIQTTNLQFPCREVQCHV
jgi:hypothetical protein